MGLSLTVHINPQNSSTVDGASCAPHLSMKHQPHRPIVLPGISEFAPLIFGTARVDKIETIKYALQCGYRAFDTAAQTQYYSEDILGDALTWAMTPLSNGGLGLSRDEIFIQTKFTTPKGQAGGIAPYDDRDSISSKVDKSITASLSKLNLDYVDVFLLHGPMPSVSETLEVWSCMEFYAPRVARNIGMSNVSLELLQILFQHATVAISVVQNAFFRGNGFDLDVIHYCRENQIFYEGYGVVRFNAALLQNQLTGWLAERTGVSNSEALLALFLSLSNGESCLAVVVGSRDEARILSNKLALEKLGVVPGFIMKGFRAMLGG